MQVRSRLAVPIGVFLLVCVHSLFAQAPFTPNQELPLPLLAPIGGPNGPLAFIVRGLEPSNRVYVQGTIYVTSIRGVSGGVDLHRWSPVVDPAPNPDGTLPFKYLGRPDGCGIFVNNQTGYTFRVNACDIAEPGAGKDTFSIDLTGPAGFAYHKEGTITEGNIQLHW